MIVLAVEWMLIKKLMMTRKRMINQETNHMVFNTIYISSSTSAVGLASLAIIKQSVIRLMRC